MLTNRTVFDTYTIEVYKYGSGVARHYINTSDHSVFLFTYNNGIRNRNKIKQGQRLVTSLKTREL